MWWRLRLRNVPHLRDVTTMLGLLSQMGVDVVVDERLGVELDASLGQRRQLGHASVSHAKVILGGDDVHVGLVQIL